MTKLTSEQIEVADYFDWLEEAYRRGWTDGMAVAPPVTERVEAMIRHLGRDPQESLGTVPPKGGGATIEKLAINSVMAGCRPAYFPVVVTALACMLEPDFNLNGVLLTTHSCEPLVIVNGPAARDLGINADHGVFGSGYRANATIGRALELIFWNLGGRRPGASDKSTFAHPGRWSFVIAENEAASPWPPLHVERGLAQNDSAVTVFACEAPQNVSVHGTAEQFLRAFVDATARVGSNNYVAGGQRLLVIGPESARVLAAAGHTKASIRRHVWEHARLTVRHLKECGAFVREYAREGWPSWIDVDDDDARVPPTAVPEDILVIVAGGEGRFCVQLPGWGFGGNAITRRLAFPAGGKE